MEGKDKFNDQLISYLLNELDDRQRASIEERINSDDESRELFEQMTRTIRLLGVKDIVEKVDAYKEWRVFEAARLRREHPEIFFNQAEYFGNEVIKEVGFKRKTRLFKIIAVIAVAASVLMAIGWGWSLINGPGRSPEQSQQATELVASRPEPMIRNFVNNSETTRNYLLQDGTEVNLAGHSEISFREPFEATKRDIRLKGSAYFKVAKDKARPFTVFSNGISTTALGTIFKVTAFESSNKIVVELIEGKVVIIGVDELKNRLEKPYYMLPGQEFVFDKSKTGNGAYVSNILIPESDNSDKSQKPLKANSGIDNPLLPKFKGSWFMFNNQSLDKVFDQLGKMFDADIVYNKEEMSIVYFIGTFNEKDSIEFVLKQICTLNNLKVKKENNKYIITK